eukprot:TRINITY_DN8481_c0_g1_i3.p1 TRINITY_DN8481_c0_g1~~TRINITY_DN8481_c0_g1_i3.p1  ORF type:complete len:183 (-),score=36.32 TRINITY_DN8481_c0_g1_i3:31-579(-)
MIQIEMLFSHSPGFSTTHVNTILDIGCGSGHKLCALSKRWECSRVIGIDLQPPVADNIEYYPNIASVPVKADFVIISQVLHHVGDPLDFIKDLKSKLNPRCYLLLKEHDVKGAVDPPLIEKVHQLFYNTKGYIACEGLLHLHSCVYWSNLLKEALELDAVSDVIRLEQGSLIGNYYQLFQKG